MKIPAIVLAACLSISLPGVYAESDVSTEAVQNAESLIENYKKASATGDPALVREAALALQKDPLAVQRVNQNETPEFKQQISADVTAVRTEAKAAAKKQLGEYYGVHEDRISFMEATNPSAEPKMGQDWDVTAQVDGMAVPMEVASPVIADTFYEAAKGHKAASPEEAMRYTHAQSVEPINQESAEAYGSGGKREIIDPKTGEKRQTTEGGEIISGSKDARMRDPEHFGHVMEHKSDLAKNRADDLRAKGAAADAVGWDMEQARQYAKQEARQIKARVEARGGQVPERVQKGNEILDQVASGEISPEAGRQELAKIGETPESIIKKGTSLVEAADKLGTTPAERIEQAKAGEGPRDVFVDNVKEKMAIRKLEREAQKMKAGPRESLLDGEGKSSSAHLEETLPDTRAEQVRERAARTASAEGLEAPKSLLDGGKSSSSHSDVRGTVEGVQDAVDWTGWAVEAYHKEQKAAAEEGRDVSWWNVGKEAAKGLAAGKSYSISKKHSEAAVAAAKKRGENPIRTIPGTMIAAAAEFANDTLTSVKRQHEEYQKEEMEKEIARAQKYGVASDPWRAKIPALMRIMGDVLQVNKLAEWWADDSAKAVRVAAEMRKRLEARAKAAVEVELTSFGPLEREIRDELLKSAGSTSDTLLALQKKYHDKMAALQELRNAMFARGMINLRDPEWEAINQSVNLLDPKVTETLRSELKPQLEDGRYAKQVETELAGCHVDAAQAAAMNVTDEERKSALMTQVQQFRTQKQNYLNSLDHASMLIEAGEYERARTQITEALSATQCDDVRRKARQALVTIDQAMAVKEKIDRMKKEMEEKDCKAIQHSIPAWDPQRETAVCSCPPEKPELNRSGEYCRVPVAEQLRTLSCAGKSAFAAYDATYDVVSCECPEGYMRDYMESNVDMNQRDCIKSGSWQSELTQSPPAVYEPVYQEPARDRDDQDMAAMSAMISQMQNAREQENSARNTASNHDELLVNPMQPRSQSSVRKNSSGSYAGFGAPSVPYSTPSTSAPSSSYTGSSTQSVPASGSNNSPCVGAYSYADQKCLREDGTYR